MKARTFSLGLLLADLVAVIVLFNVAGHLRGAPASGTIALTPLAMPALAVAFALYLIDGYSSRTDMLSLEFASLHAIALLGAMLLTLLLTFVFIPTGYELQSSRLVISLSYLALIPVTLAYRRRVYLRRMARRGRRHLVFLGDRASGEAFAAECRRMGTEETLLFATAGPAAGAGNQPEAPAESRPLQQVIAGIEQGTLAVEAIVLRESARALPTELSQRLVQLYFADVPTYTLELFHEVHWRKIPLYRLNQTWLFQQGFQIAREPVFERLKRASDILLALGGLLLSAPLIVSGAALVWLDDRGPVLFLQTRIGRSHVPFRILKLRTMRTVPPDETVLYTQPGDARITRVGRWLRATRIDELPQLWNVLRGEMSLIGPRAEWDRLVQRYEREIPCYHFRHIVRPGITGWAQVNYPYGASTEDTLRKLEYDLYYIRHYSFLLDAAIVLKTIHLMLLGKGR